MQKIVTTWMNGRGLRMSLSFWRRLVRRRPRELTHLQFVMYTRAGCHLCKSAWSALLEAQRSYRFGLTSIDVDGDPRLAARFGDEVPVIEVNGKVRFRGGLNRVLLARLIDAERRRSQP